MAEDREIEHANHWALHGEHGISSVTMFNVLCKKSGIRPIQMDWNHHPNDPADFKRCYGLIKTVPEWRSRLDELKSLGKPWPDIVDNWDKLEEMVIEAIELWREGKGAKEMYRFMKSIGC